MPHPSICSDLQGLRLMLRQVRMIDYQSRGHRCNSRNDVGYQLVQEILRACQDILIAGFDREPLNIPVRRIDSCTLNSRRSVHAQTQVYSFLTRCHVITTSGGSWDGEDASLLIQSDRYI